MKKRALAFILSVAMVILVLPAMVLAFEFSDMPDDWSKTALERAVENGLLTGANGKLMPRNNLTRAQMAAVLNRAFGAAKKASLNSYTDVAFGAWYYDDMAKAVHMKTLLGSGVNLNPDSNITREEAFVVLARALKLTGSSPTILDMFADQSEISSWSEDGIASLVSAGYIAGSNGRLYPKQNITRAEFAQIMYNLFKHYIKTPGTYSEIPEGNIMINTPGVTLKDVTVKGDLIIGDGVGDGNIILDNVKVTGRTVVRGGGPDSIKIIGGSELGSVMISKVDGNIRVVIETGVTVEVLYIDDGKDDVIIEGEIGSVIFDAANAPVVLRNAVVTNMTVTAPDASITVESTAAVDRVTVSQTASDADLYIDGTAAAVTTEADGTLIEGGGTVVYASIQGDGCCLSTAGTIIEVGKSASGTTIGSQTVNSGTTGRTDFRGELLIPAAGGGSSSSSASIKISAITVTAQENETVVANGKTLQMLAAVTPSNAANKKVSWSVVDGTGSAAISNEGLLTAEAVGTVTVEAAAQDGSDVIGTKVIDIALPLKIKEYTGDQTDVVIPKVIDGPEGLTEYDDFTFQISGTGEPAVLEENQKGLVTEIGSNAFTSCGLTNITIPNSVTLIDSFAFYSNKITHLEIPDSVISINLNAFGNNELTSLTIPDSINTIGDGAFSGNQITKLALGSKVEYIGDSAFYDNPLEGVVIPDSVTYIGNKAFGSLTEDEIILGKGCTTYFVYNQDSTMLNGYIGLPDPDLDLTTIPISVTNILDQAFKSRQLTSVIIPDYIEVIGFDAFAFNNLTDITFPDSIKKLGQWSFRGNQLERITIGEGVVIGEHLLTEDNNLFRQAYQDGGAGTYIGTQTGEWTKVTIRVTGEGDAATITTNGGILQMSAAVSPDNVSNKAVTWSVTQGTGDATISPAGLLTAVADGTVTVVAALQDGSGVTGELEITISNQNQTINIAAIPGVTGPVLGETPVTEITETDQYTGTVTWDPEDSPFEAETVYTATITLTAKAGFTLDGTVENFFTVDGATATNAENAGVITAVFSATGQRQK